MRNAADKTAESTELISDVSALTTLRSTVKCATSTADVTAALATLSSIQRTPHLH